MFVILTLDWFLALIQLLKTILNDFNEEAKDMKFAESYASLRSKAIKHITETVARGGRLFAGNGCADFRVLETRVTEIERVESTGEYSIAEIELLATFFGKHPHDILRVTGQNAIELGATDNRNADNSTLQDVVDCVLPKRIEQLYESVSSNRTGTKSIFLGKLCFPQMGKLLPRS